MKTVTQLRQKPNRMASPAAASAAARPSRGHGTRAAVPSDEQDGDGDHVADDVGQHRTEQRRQPADRQAAEPVGHAVLEVDVDGRAGGDHAGEPGAHDEDAGEQVLQVLGGGAGHRTAEQVEEQHHEQGRRDHPLIDRRRVAAVFARLRRASTTLCRSHGERPRAGGRREGGVSCVRPRGRWWAPVRERKTSSRLGRRSESSLTPMAVLSSCAVISKNSASPATGCDQLAGEWAGPAPARRPRATIAAAGPASVGIVEPDDDGVPADLPLEIGRGARRDHPARGR